MIHLTTRSTKFCHFLILPTSSTPGMRINEGFSRPSRRLGSRADGRGRVGFTRHVTLTCHVFESRVGVQARYRCSKRRPPKYSVGCVFQFTQYDVVNPKQFVFGYCGLTGKSCDRLTVQTSGSVLGVQVTETERCMPWRHYRTQHSVY